MERSRSFDKSDTLTVKGLAILLMLFYHLFESENLCISMNVDYAPLSMNTLLVLSGFGNICVALFVFLSAYGITKGLSVNFGREKGEYLRLSMQQACKRWWKLTIHFAVMYLSVNLLWFRFFDYKGLYGTGWQGGMFALLDMCGLAQIFDTPTLNMTWWYMELAILIIFLVPLLLPLIRKMGAYILIPGMLLPSVVEMNGDLKRYFMVMLLGMVCASEGWFEKLHAMKADKPLRWNWIGLTVGVLLLILAIPFRQNYMVHTYFLWLVDGPVALLICWFVGWFVSCIPGIGSILRLFGKHSMNIFFVHTFFYMAIYQKFIYSFHYAGVILVVLLGVSLIYSMVLEGVKWCIKRLLKSNVNH